MRYYMVTLADPEGRDQRVLVQAPETDSEAEIASYILNPATRGTKGETVIASARVIGVRPLHIKRPVLHTVMPEVIKA